MRPPSATPALHSRRIRPIATRCICGPRSRPAAAGPRVLIMGGLTMPGERERRRMVDDQLRRRGIKDSKTLDAFRTVPREAFVPPDAIGLAYSDSPLPIGDGQTISQPYVVAITVE